MRRSTTMASETERILLHYQCPLCTTLVKEGSGVKDPRWEKEVHISCRDKLSRWPKHGFSPTGKYGTDDIHQS